MPDSKRTALYDTHKRYGARLIPFGGWEMPVEYSGIAAEHAAVRNAVGLFDVSHMGELFVRGDGARELLQYVTSNDVSLLEDGQAQYSAMANEGGRVVDDLLVYRINAENYMMVVNAANIAKDFQWLQSHNGTGARIEDASDRTTMLATQGPRSQETLATLTDVDLSRVAYYRFSRAKLAGVDGIASRTGYTGEDGFEFYFDRDQSEAVWEAILESGKPHGILPVGLGARNTLRLEAKMLLYGNDMDETTTLLEAGLGWIAKLDKGSFVGREALVKQKETGLKRKLVGFEMLGRDIARDHYAAVVGGEEVGHVTSGSPSITLKKNIGLAYLPIAHTRPGTRFEVRVRKRLCGAAVVKTPFYKRRSSV